MKISSVIRLFVQFGLYLVDIDFPNTEYHPNMSKFDVEAYKLTGPAEQTHGDIAVVVSRSFMKVTAQYLV